MSGALVIMSRVPKAGRTKTRLMNRLTGEECAKIHSACLDDICEAARKLEIERYIYYTGGRQDEFGEVNLTGFNMCRQTGKDLGQRLRNAAEKVLSIHDRLLIVGADVPDLTPGLLFKALEKLDDHDIVIGPALDGGYYLVGMKKLHESIFQNIPWGTAEVYMSTINTLDCNGLSYFVLETRQDIDTWQDLVEYYNQSAERSTATRAAKAIADVVNRILSDSEGK